ncbi:MAG: hypothetical protein M3015_09550 [Bacteroidota bacterium]|nr:hypothetical protein [Bacteroidota bacterium]
MQNENPNSDFHWKSKLESLENLPGETFNKDAAWDKLHGREHKKRTNGKAVWYWAAAACLLIALFIPWFISKKNENTLVKNSPLTQESNSAVTVLLPSNNKDSGSVLSSVAIENKRPPGNAEINGKIIFPARRKIVTVQNTAIKKEREEFREIPIINSSVTPLDTQVSIVAIVPEKRKLRVVHINELGDPVEELPAIAHKTKIHSFQIKIANQEVFVNPSISARKTGFTILSTKNSPN